MKLAHVDTARTWRGGQAQVLVLATDLARRGHSVSLYAPEGPLAERARARALDVQSFSAVSDFDAAAALRLAAAWRRDRPELVHLHSARAHAVGALAALWAGRLPVVVSRRVDFDVAEHPLSALKYRFGVDRFLCISEGVRRVLERGGVRPERLEVVPSGIDVERWRERADPSAIRAELGIPAGTVVVGALSALAPHKHLANLLAAAGSLARSRPDVRWVVFGEGEMRADLEAERRRLGLDDTVLFPGFTERVQEAMSLLSVFVLSSYLEGLGTSVLDAQAAGVPVVATAVGGVPEMIEDGENGWLVPPRHPQALAAAVADALARPEESCRRARRARETVRRFSIENMVTRTEAAYQSVLAARARASR